MQSLEAAYEEGEVTPSICDCLFKMVCTHNKSFKKAKLSSQRSSLSSVLDNVPTYNDSPHSSACSTTITTPQKPQFCIHTKLLELYLEESAKDPNQLKTGLKRNTQLLEKLVARERLNTIILNLYPGNKGYSITFPTSPLSDTCTEDTAEMIESKTWPYEDTELLRYLDLEELPAFIVDLLEPAHSFLFYSGCIVAKVRDYRQAFPMLKCDIHHVLLRPTAQSILADVHKIAEEWSAEDKAQLESRILLAHHPTLCLESSTSHLLSTRTSRLHHNRHLLNTHRIRRAAMKYSQVTVNRRKKLMSHTYRPGLELFEHLTRVRTRPKSSVSLFAKSARREEVRPIPAPSLETVPIAPPSGDVNITEFKAYSPAREFRESGDAAAFPQFMENCQPQLVEEYVLETDMHSKEPDKRRVYQMKLSILQRPLNGEYLGELYLDRDHKKGERNGVASRFSLGTRVQANRYIQQFTEIFTESGRKSVRVNYCFAQNHPQVCFKVQNQPTPQVAANVQTPSTAQPNYSLSYQTLPPGANSVVNGTVNLVPAQQTSSASVPLLQAQLQTNKQTQDANSEHAFSVLATKLMNSVQQIQAANAKQATQKSTCSNAAIINILNRSPASNINSDANAAVVNAINNSQLLAAQQQQQTKLVGRKITVANMPANARVLNAANVISVNNNRSMADGTLHASQQQITLTTVAGSNFFTTVTVPKPTARSNNDGGKAALSALLVGTAAADRPDISSANTNSLLLEKLAGVSSSSNKNPTSPSFIQSPKQYVAQSPKISPLASPPPQTQTINVQGLNYTTLQGLQGVQVQLPGFAQPMRAFLNVTSTGGLQGQSLLVSVPVTTTANNSGGGSSQCVNNNNSSVANAISVGNMGTSTVVLATNSGTSNLAQLVTTGVKRVGTQGTVLTTNNSPLQLVTPIQRPRIQQAQQLQQARVQFQQQQLQQVQRQTPITIKMATTSGTVGAQAANVTQQVQKQFQHQQVQLQLNQQQFHQQTSPQPQHIHLNKIARRSSQNVSDPP